MHATFLQKVFICLFAAFLAASLLQQSISVEIFEQDTELREIGAGVAIAGNATRLLQGLGVDLAQAELRHLGATEILESLRRAEHVVVPQPE